MIKATETEENGDRSNNTQIGDKRKKKIRNGEENGNPD